MSIHLKPSRAFILAISVPKDSQGRPKPYKLDLTEYRSVDRYSRMAGLTWKEMAKKPGLNVQEVMSHLEGSEYEIK